MQKAVVVRFDADEMVRTVSSYEVDSEDAPRSAPLRELLAAGWRVVHSCPMPGELESCCLLILEDRTPPVPNASRGVDRTADFTPDTLPACLTTSVPTDEWDGESISLRPFGLD